VRRGTRSVLGAITLFLLIAALGFAYSSRGGGSADRLMTVFFINLVIVVGMQTFIGNSGILSFGHVGFAAVAAYTTAILSSATAVKAITIPDAPFGVDGITLPVWASGLIAVAVGTAMAWLIGLAITRLSGMSAAIVTLAMLIVIHSVLTNLDELTGGAEAFYGIPNVTTKSWAMLAALLALVVARLFRGSGPGLRLQASREDEVAAASMGVDLVRARMGAWVLSASIVAAGGVLLTHFLGAISPSGFYFSLTFLTLAMLVLGGMHSVTGAAVGTIVMTAGSEFTRYVGDGPMIFGFQLPQLFGLSQLFLGAVIILTMIFRPSGVVGGRELDELLSPLLTRVRRRWLRSEAKPRLDARSGPFRRARAAGNGQRLRVREVSKVFVGLAAVDGVSLDVQQGEIVGLIGPNGAGKTTLLNTISGLLAPTTGEITVGNISLTGMTMSGVARAGIARTFQNIRLFEELTVRENVAVSASVAAVHRAEARRLTTEQILTEFALTQLAGRKAKTLQFGAQRRVEVARAVALAPNFLLLDEPAAGMNEVESLRLLSEIRHLRDLLGCGVLVVDHDLAFIMGVCERIYVLNQGKLIASGPPQEIQRDAGVISAYLGTAAPVSDSAGLAGDSG
jgi:branched-chain amino acid transport system permease protein